MFLLSDRRPSPSPVTITESYDGAGTHTAHIYIRYICATTSHFTQIYTCVVLETVFFDLIVERRKWKCHQNEIIIKQREAQRIHEICSAVFMIEVGCWKRRRNGMVCIIKTIESSRLRSGIGVWGRCERKLEWMFIIMMMSCCMKRLILMFVVL